MATFILVALNLVAYALELAQGGQAACAAYGFTAAHPTLETALTSLFLHDPDHLAHLGGNLVFLVVFGAIVERALGSWRLLGLYVAAGLGGAAMHWMADPSAVAPLVGASGALFGLMALAGVLRPRLLGFVTIYVGLNIWNALTGDESGVSFGCHLGGFVVGALVVAALRLGESEALEAA